MRQNQGQPSIGFLNPTLYSNTSKDLFNDVVSGGNSCCAVSSYSATATCCSAGFTSTPGWDPVTGWGSITYSNLALMLNVSYTSYVEHPYDGSTERLYAIYAAIVVGVLVFFSIIAAYCYSYNPLKLSSQREAQYQRPNDDPWRCSVCTLENSPDAARCSICNTRRGKAQVEAS